MINSLVCDLMACDSLTCDLCVSPSCDTMNKDGMCGKISNVSQAILLLLFIGKD